MQEATTCLAAKKKNLAFPLNSKDPSIHVGQEYKPFSLLPDIFEIKECGKTFH